MVRVIARELTSALLTPGVSSQIPSITIAQEAQSCLRTLKVVVAIRFELDRINCAGKHAHATGEGIVARTWECDR